MEKVGYGPNWPKQRARALKRDDYTCQKCGHKGKKKGRYWDVHVHHRRKIAWFADTSKGVVDWEAANNLNNLVTLCIRCHKVADQHDNPSKRGFKYIK